MSTHKTKTRTRQDTTTHDQTYPHKTTQDKGKRPGKRQKTQHEEYAQNQR